MHNGGDIPYINTYQVENVEEMIENVINLSKEADGLISAAAIADYGTEPSKEKLKSGAEEIQLKLHRKPKLLDIIRKKFPDLVIIGFKAEVEEDRNLVIERSRELLNRARLSFVVANNANVIGLEKTRVEIVRRDSILEREGSKREIGLEIAEELSKEIKSQ